MFFIKVFTLLLHKKLKPKKKVNNFFLLKLILFRYSYISNVKSFDVISVSSIPNQLPRTYIEITHKKEC